MVNLVSSRKTQAAITEVYEVTKPRRLELGQETYHAVDLSMERHLQLVLMESIASLVTIIDKANNCRDCFQYRPCQANAPDAPKTARNAPMAKTVVRVA